jgi:cell fate (sporulation/competence/biofilm development) regulator YlbF (YheA/YmcA/DUF963 family)
MDRVIQLARRLGQAIAEDPRCTALKEARTAFEADAEARQLREDYDEAVSVLQQKLARGEPLEPEEKRREAELRSKVAGSETLRRLVRAQADFQQLMTEANEAIESETGLGQDLPEAG